MGKRMPRIRMGVVVVVVFMAMFGMACLFTVEPLKFSDDKRRAMESTENFHQLFNQEKYGEMYNLFTEKGRDSVSEQQFVDQLKMLHGKAGLVRNSQMMRSDVRIVGGSTVVHMFYRTDFEHLSLFEEFDCVTSGERVLFDFYGHLESLPDSLN